MIKWRDTSAMVSEEGFTILETMIVMSVTAAMLVSAVTLFSGEQRKTQFSQSLRDIESKVQDAINDTETGYFPNIGGTRCDITSGEPVVTAGASEQGANPDCIFLGKTILFKEDQMVLYPIVGTRELTSSTTGLVSSASPVAVDILKEEKNYLWGLALKDIYFGNDGTSRLSDGALVSIASSPNGTGFSGSNLNSGTQRINSYVSGLGGADSVSYTNASVATLNDSLQSISANSWPVSPSVVVLCFEDSPSGSGRKYGGIVIGGGLQGIATRIQVLETGEDGFVCT